MTKVRALAIAAVTVFFFVPAGLLILGIEGFPTSNTVRGFAYQGLITVWWGRAAIAAFLVFLGTLLILPRPKKPEQ
jgi:hypothetical protein